MAGDISKLRGHPVKCMILSYSSNVIMAYVNRIRYSKNSYNRDNPQPSNHNFLWLKVQRLNGDGLSGSNI